MIFRQLFHAESSTYTYLLADRASHEALLIDPSAIRSIATSRSSTSSACGSSTSSTPMSTPTTSRPPSAARPAPPCT